MEEGEIVPDAARSVSAPPVAPVMDVNVGGYEHTRHPEDREHKPHTRPRSRTRDRSRSRSRDRYSGRRRSRSRSHSRTRHHSSSRHTRRREHEDEYRYRKDKDAKMSFDADRTRKDERDTILKPQETMHIVADQEHEEEDILDVRASKCIV